MTKVNLQDTFLEQAKNNNCVVTIHLVGKVKLMGTIKDYDKHSVTINTYGQDQHIYKQAISTIVLPRGYSTRLMIPKTETAGEEGQSGEAMPPRFGPRPPRPMGGRPPRPSFGRRPPFPRDRRNFGGPPRNQGDDK
ncbi:MAG: RNA chaperone Hfq [Acidobacteriota bacterium]